MAQPDQPELELNYAFSMRIDNSGSISFQGPMRSRTFEPASGGEIWGPRLQGRVVPQSGADFASNNMLDTHLMLQASDGAWIYMNLIGYENEVVETTDGSPYFRVTPFFDTPVGPHDWLTKTVLVGTGTRMHNPNHTIIHYYELL